MLDNRLASKGAAPFSIRTLAFETSHGQGDVLTTEAKRVVECYSDWYLASLIGYIIQIALRVWVLEVDRGRNDPVLYRL